VTGKPWYRTFYVPIILLIVAAILPAAVDSLSLLRFQEIFIYMLVAMGMNIGFGYGGQFSLAGPVLMGVAAYGAAIASVREGWSPYATLPVAVLAAVIVGVALSLPAYRIKGWYLAVVTIFSAVVFPGVVIFAASWTGGTNGLPGVGPLPGTSIGTGASAVGFWIVLGCVVVVWLAMRNISTSIWGLLLRSVRDAPNASQASGVNQRTVNICASVASAIPAGIAGWLWAHTTFFVSSDAFNFNLLLLITAAVFLGGRGTIWGPVLGTVIFESLSLLVGPFSATNQLVLGLGLLILAIIAPHGLIAYIRTAEPVLRRQLRAVLPEVITGRLGAPVNVPVRTANTLPVYRSAGSAVPAPSATVTEGCVVEARGLSKSFGGLTVLEDVDLTLSAGEAVGIVGPNGSGKTTLLNLLTGFIRRDTGTILVRGRDITSGAPYSISRLGMRRTFQVPQLIAELSVMENIWLGLAGPKGQHIAGSLLRGPRYRRFVREGWQRVHEVCDFLGLSQDLRIQPVSSLPLGLRRVVEIGRAIADPQMSAVFMDEPASGLSMDETVQLGTVIRRLVESGTPVVLIEHNLRFVREVCDRIVQMEAGRLVGVIELRAKGDEIETAAVARSVATPVGVHAQREEPVAVAGSTGTAGGAPSLEIRDLSAWYGQARALDSVSLTVEAAGVIALIGNNGAGKSTLLRSIARAHRRASGSILLGGEEIIGKRIDEAAALGVSLVREGSRVFDSLTVTECIEAAKLLARRRHTEPRPFDEILEWLPVLRPLRKTTAGYLSGGQRQALALAMAFTSGASCMLLDEPSGGLHESVVESTFFAIGQIAKEGVTLLIAEQKVLWLHNLASKAYVLETGSVVGVVDGADLASIDLSLDGSTAKV
jgi:branched-chain amino acid transport system permease protein